MFVSTTATSRSNANASTARAVYGPMPGSASKRVEIVGNHAVVLVDDGTGRELQVARPPGIPEPLPEPQDVTERCGRTRRQASDTRS